MSWLVGSWKLKILAVVLAVLLLGAVAFSENPPTVKQVPIGVSYQNMPPGLVLVNPPTTVKVTVSGLANAVKQFGDTSVGAVVDVSEAKVGNGETFYAQVAPPTSDVSVDTPRVPVRLDVDAVATRQLDVEVRTNLNSQQGLSVVPEGTYATCGNDTTPCKLTVSGPRTIVNGLKAFVSYDAKLTAVGIERAPGLQVQFDRNNQPFDLKKVRTQPEVVSISPPVVTARIETQGGQLTKTVAINVPAYGQPACGYRVDSLSISPGAFATISGPNSAMDQVDAVSVDPISISGATSSQTFDRTLSSSVRGIRVVDPSSGGVRITVSISQSFSCAAASPAPSPSSSPSPSPGH